MPFKTLARMGKSARKIEVPRDVLKNVPGRQTRKMVEDIVLDVIKNRRTVRQFNSKDVTNSDLLNILNSGRYAPSAGNQQPWEFIVIRSKPMKEKIAHACYDQMWLTQAPIILIVCTNMILATSKFKDRGERLYSVQGVAAAIENMLIAAESLGISSAWIGGFSERAISILTQCPDYIRPCAVLAFGYAAEQPPVPPRQELKEYTHSEYFGNLEIEKERNEEIY